MGKYKDVSTAAQAAFQSAATAAAAAKAAIELSKSDSQGGGTRDHNAKRGKMLDESDKTTEDMSLNSDSDLEIVEEEEVSYYVKYKVPN
jgi:hypothetical protein